MESFHWDDCFITGLSEVDDQHHHLVDMINQFGDLIADNTVNMDDIDTLYRQLNEYAAYHFQEEEQLMAQSGLDARHLNHHIDIHNRFLDEITSIYASTSIDNLEQSSALLKYLIHWLAYHILGEDQDMAKQMQAIASGMSAADAYQQLEQERDQATAPLLVALNGLFEQVSLRNKELKQLNESLEEKVAQRTQELSELNRHLNRLSMTDVLTGLPNRRHAMSSLADHWQTAQARHQPLVCMMIDADHFKEVNDVYGHDVGDRVLNALALTLRDAFHNDDLVCRLGGDEFLAICPNTDFNGALYLGEKIRQQVAGLRVETGGDPWYGSISVGVAFTSFGHGDVALSSYESLIKQADKGVYAAKAAGKNCVRSVYVSSTSANSASESKAASSASGGNT